MKWVIGQRVVSAGESELGLGMVVAIEAAEQFLEVLYAEEEILRRYSIKNAPLERYIIPVGKKATTKTGESFTVESVRESEGLFYYESEIGEIPEFELSSDLDRKEALDLLLAGDWSHSRSFDLRWQALKLQALELDPGLKGIASARISLLPHQIDIAYEVGNRPTPRVLLADEVGLGKTIEAGLIMSVMKNLGRAERVLVLCPDSLKHQWLTEMFRRFTVSFALVDEDRSLAEMSSQGQSAFSLHQNIISSLDFLLQNPDRERELLDENWDLIIVDEAHHLRWDEEQGGDSNWRLLKQLSKQTNGLVLLSATPQQNGLNTQFGLLNLIDPDRFAFFENYKDEVLENQRTSELAKELLNQSKALPETLNSLKEIFSDDQELCARADAVKSDPEKLQHLLDALIDRHGTGRVFFRNRRERILPLPKRALKPIPIALSAKLQSQFLKDNATTSLQGMLSFHERLLKLQEELTQKPHEKIFAITSSLKDVQAAYRHFSQNTGFRIAVFHEELDLIERDRQAAWFAKDIEDNGAQVLVSSEIGGEGRNFQFAHKLFLLDLPLDPDLLEQRIGRLDRIGQRREIEVFVPYVANSPEEVLMRWYAEGLQSFTRCWHNLGPLFKDFEALIRKTAEMPVNPSLVKELIDSTRSRVATLQEENAKTRDFLVDLNSFNQQRAETLKSKILEHEELPELESFMESAFESFGVEYEIFEDEDIIKLNSSSLMYVDSFPELPLEGDKLVTYNRDIALAREELSFLTLGHPMVSGVQELIVDTTLGKASVALLSKEELNCDGAILEALYVLDSQIEAFLKAKPFLVHLSHKGNTIAPSIREKLLTSNLTMSELSENYHDSILQSPLFKSHLPRLVEKANKTALDLELQQYKDSALKKARSILQDELSRHEYLNKGRTTAALKRRHQEILENIEHSKLRLDSIRFLVLQ